MIRLIICYVGVYRCPDGSHYWGERHTDLRTLPRTEGDAVLVHTHTATWRRPA